MYYKIIAQLKAAVLQANNGDLILDLTVLNNNPQLKIKDLLTFDPEILKKELSEIGLSSRSLNALRTRSIETLGDLSEQSISLLHRSRGIGKESFHEILNCAASLSRSAYRQVIFSKADRILSEHDLVVLQRKDRVLTLDHKALLQSSGLTIADLMQISTEDQEIDISQLKITALVRQILLKELENPIIKDLINYPLQRLAIRQGLGRSALEKLLNQLAIYATDTDSIKLQ